MRDPAGVRQVGGGVVDDQIISVDALGDRAVAQGAEVDLLEGRAAEPQQQEHAVCVRVVFGRGRGQVVVEVLFKGVSHPVALSRAAVAVVSDLHRAVGR